MTDEELHPCPLCPRRYKRREHLHRHWSSHNPAKQHTCAQCGRAFQRLDVLKRHARTCEARARGWMAPAVRRRACDTCVRQKRACSMRQPCENCERLAVACRYPFPSGTEATSQAATGNDSVGSQAMQATGTAAVDAVPLTDLSFVLLGDPAGDGMLGTHTSPIWPDFMQLIPGGPYADDFSIPSVSQQEERTGDDEAAGRRCTFMFLENFTRRTDLLEPFECGSPALRERILAHFVQRQVEGDPLSMPGLPDTLGTPPTDGPVTGAQPFAAVQNPWLHDH